MHSVVKRLSRRVETTCRKLQKALLVDHDQPTPIKSDHGALCQVLGCDCYIRTRRTQVDQKRSVCTSARIRQRHRCANLKMMPRSNDQKRPVVPAERRRMILEILRAEGSISVAAVEDGFEVSPMTARRDLALLAENGYARRTHGGAVLPELAGHEDSFQNRLEHGAEVKIKLARASIQTINPHETVFVDSSSTAYYIVREVIEAGMPLTLLTNSLPVMTIIGSANAPNVEMIGLGGTFRKLTRSYVGAETVRMVQRYFVDRVLFSVKGIECDGSLTDPDPLEAEVKRAMISRARTVQFVADAQKFDEHGLNVVVDAGRVDIAYFASPPGFGQKLFGDAGAEVHVV